MLMFLREGICEGGKKPNPGIGRQKKNENWHLTFGLVKPINNMSDSRR